MRRLLLGRLLLVGVTSLIAAAALIPTANAQSQNGRPLVLRVQPRSFLDPGTAAPVGSMNRYVTSGQTSTMIMPPWNNPERLVGGSVLPDPIGGPFVGARNPFPPIPIETTGSIR